MGIGVNSLLSNSAGLVVRTAARRPADQTLSTHLPRPDPEKLATGRSSRRPADHTCASAPYPVAVQHSHTKAQAKSSIQRIQAQDRP
jgi:hypothetical protein